MTGRPPRWPQDPSTWPATTSVDRGDEVEMVAGGTEAPHRLDHIHLFLSVATVGRERRPGPRRAMTGRSCSLVDLSRMPLAIYGVSVGWIVHLSNARTSAKRAFLCQEDT